MHLHLDCFSGIAGDMMLGALVDLGAPRDALEAELKKLEIEGWSLRFAERDAGHGMRGLGVEVRSQELSSAHRGAHETAEGGATTPGEGDPDAYDTQEHEPVVLSETDFGDSPDRDATQEWGPVALEAVLRGGQGESQPDRAHPPDSAQAHHHHRHRTYAEIAERIAEAGLSSRAERRAQAVFRRIGEAEAKVHGIPLEHVHFHEVGAIDSIVDIVGVAVALDLLDVETITATPLPLGRGFTRSQHGHIPIPAPATLECLRGVPCFDSGLEVELVTPTGAGLVGALTEGFLRLPEMTVERIGYGAGTRRHADRPNLLRVLLGERLAMTPLERDEVWELAANIDDQSGESLAHAVEALWSAGALDVWATPAVMKKGRPGHLLQALVPPHRCDAAATAMLRHTTSLGVRLTRHERARLARDRVVVETRFGGIGVKVGRGPDGTPWNLAPEADECAAAADAAGVPVKLVYQVALAAAVDSLL